MTDDELNNDIFIHNPDIDEFFAVGVKIVHVTEDSIVSDILDPGNHYITFVT